MLTFRDERKKESNSETPELPVETYQDAEGERHKVYVVTSGGSAEVMRASEHPVPMEQYLKADGVETEEESAFELVKKINDSTKKFVELKKKQERTPDEEGQLKELADSIGGMLARLRAEMEKIHGADPELEKHRADFEQELGAYASEDPRATRMADTVCNQAWRIAKAYAEKTTKDAQTLDERLDEIAKQIGRPIDCGFFGVVGQSVQDIEQCVQRGSFREKYLIGYNFQEFWGNEICRNDKDDEFFRSVLQKANEYLKEIHEKPVDVDASMDRRRLVKPRLDKEGVKDPKEKPKHYKIYYGSDPEMYPVKYGKKYDNEAFREARAGEAGEMDCKFPSVPIEFLDEEELRFLCRKKGQPDTGSKSELVERLNKIGVYESEEGEKNFMARTRIRKDGEEDRYLRPGGKEKGTGPRDSSKYYNFIQGSLANVVNERHWWVKSARKLSMPIKAGVSGTTQRYMQFGRTLGVSPMNHLRLMLLGALIPTHAHSFHEIMTAAQGFPGCIYKEGSYTQVAPLTRDELIQIAGKLNIPNLKSAEEKYRKVCYKSRAKAE